MVSHLLTLQLAKLPSDDMKVIKSLQYLVGSDAKKTGRPGGFSLKFDAQKVKSFELKLVLYCLELTCL
jgi:hypothetical protein